MRHYPNLPRQQWFTRQVVDGFNRDEERWRQAMLQRLKRALLGVRLSKGREKIGLQKQMRLIFLAAEKV